jgi:peptide chain release factor-like protein
MALNTHIVSEFHFQTSRSGGKGGQHVNTTESKVELVLGSCVIAILSFDIPLCTTISFGSQYHGAVRHEQKIVVQSPTARLDFSTSLEMTRRAGTPP